MSIRTLSDAELVTASGGQALNQIPGAYRNGAGMRVPTPTGTPMQTFGSAAASGEANAQRPRDGGGGGGGSMPAILPNLL